MKRIVVCADGTWNQRDQVVDRSGLRKPTNVTKLARAVLPRDASGVHQVVCYHDGVGTGGPLDRFTGGAFGHGIENNIRVLYRFILYNWVPGDELYFFGFSRGAFTVRSLCGFMRHVGIIEKDDDYYLPELYACYEQGAGPGSPQWQHAHHRITGGMPCPPIRFVGVWDTVGALGAPGVLGQLLNRDKYKYLDVGLNEHIENAVHAMALDERRKPFAPTLWKRPPGWNGQLVQAWFPGVHSNVGGGYKPDGLANEALHWVAQYAEGLGLALDGAYLANFKPCFNSVLHDSMSLMYKVMGPLVRPVGLHADHGELIHRSALDRMALGECRYTPANLARQRPVAVADTTRIERGTPC